MNIIPLRQYVHGFYLDASTPTSSRKIGCYYLHNVRFCGRNLHYPNLLCKTPDALLSPYDERVMSLQCDSFYENNLYSGSISVPTTIVSDPVFFFCLNVDNYFHFIYDTLPYLVYYFELKETVPNCKLLVQTSHSSKKSLPLFVKETLDLLNLHDLLFLQDGTLYTDVFVGLSLTHGGQSNDPPHPLAFTIWNSLTKAAIEKVGDSLPRMDMFYVSRRSWLSKHPENIGTNYTTRRRCVNEDELVEYLKAHDVQEVFCEDLSMAEKIVAFSRAKKIIGIIGGGMCNCLFSPPTVEVHCLLTPSFLDVNYRFGFSMIHTNPIYSQCCPLAPYEGSFSLYTRVKIDNPSSSYHGCIGEIESYKDEMYSIKISKEGVAGFSQDFVFDTVELPETYLRPLDKGLNSPYLCDLDRFKQTFPKQE